MSKKIVLTSGAALMVVAGWLGSAPAEADRVSPLNEIQRSHIAVPKFVEGGYFAFPDSPLVARARVLPSLAPQYRRNRDERGNGVPVRWETLQWR
jgi:hypothetical protein